MKLPRSLVLALKVIAPALVIAASIGVFKHLKATKPEAKRRKPPISRPLVEVQSVSQGSKVTAISGNGTVMAAQQMVVMPQISGQITKQHPALQEGGIVKAREMLITIDNREYELAASEASANIARARLELQVERGRKRIAEREWKLVETTDLTSPEGKALALRLPHIRQVKAQLAAARTAKERAQLSVDRAEIRAPYNAIVVKEGVELGQVVGPQSQVATLIGTDAFWVKVSVPVHDIPRLRIPGVNAETEQASGATVRLKGGEGLTATWPGTVKRLLDEVDPRGRMAQLIVEVKDPLDLEAPDNGQPVPLLRGAYVEVELQGETLNRVVEIPRVALRNGNAVWTLDADHRLRIKPVTVAFRSRQTVLIGAGLGADDRIITSRIAAPVEGMELDTAETQKAKRAAAASPPAERTGDASGAPKAEAAP